MEVKAVVVYLPDSSQIPKGRVRFEIGTKTSGLTGGGLFMYNQVITGIHTLTTGAVVVTGESESITFYGMPYMLTYKNK